MRLSYLLLALLFVNAVIAVAASQGTAPSVAVQRVVDIGTYGLATIHDDFAFKGPGELNSFEVGLSKEFSNDLRYVEARDGQGRKLTIDLNTEKEGGFYWYRIRVGRSLGSGETYGLNVTSVFENLVTLYRSEFRFRLDALPVLKEQAEGGVVTIMTPFGSRFDLADNTARLKEITFRGRPAVQAIYKPLKAQVATVLSVEYSSVNQFILQLKRAERDVSVTEDGRMAVTDRYEFYNPAFIVSRIPIRLYDGATNIMAYDLVGPLWNQPRSGSDVTMTPRYPSGLTTNETFTFSLKYDVPASKYLRQLRWGGLYNLTFQLFTKPQEWVIDDLKVSVTLPSGVRMDKSSVALAPKANSIYDQSYSFEGKGFTPLNDYTLQIVYKYPVFWAAIKPLTWVVILEAALVSFVLLMRFRRTEAQTVPLPVETVSEFVQFYDEKMALGTELVRMEEDVGRGALNRHEYRRRRKAVDLRLQDLNRSLAAARTKLAAAQRRYADIFQQIDRAEAEIEAAKASEAQIRAQYRGGRVSRHTFESLTRDLRKRSDRARRTIETVVIALREEAG